MAMAPSPSPRLERRHLLAALLATFSPLGSLSCSSPYRVLHPLAGQEKIESLSLQVIAPKRSTDVLKQRLRVVSSLKKNLQSELKRANFQLVGQAAQWHLVVEVLAIAYGRTGPGNGVKNQGRCAARVHLFKNFPGHFEEEQHVSGNAELQLEVTAREESRGKYDRTPLGDAAIRRCARLIADYLKEVSDQG